MSLVCSMIVGPGESHRYLDRTLRCASQWADTILVVADRPDPDTLDACDRGRHITGAGHPRAGFGVTRALRHGNHFHESTVRNEMLAMHDDWLDENDVIVSLDADEELCSIDGGNPKDALAQIQKDADRAFWAAQFWHLWNPDGTMHRVDPLWQPSVGYRAWRHQPGVRHADRRIGVPPIPNAPRHANGPVLLAIKHWGYARPHDRERKHAYYMETDGGEFHLRSHLESIISEPTLEPVPGTQTCS